MEGDRYDNMAAGRGGGVGEGASDTRPLTLHDGHLIFQDKKILKNLQKNATCSNQFSAFCDMQKIHRRGVQPSSR